MQTHTSYDAQINRIQTKLDQARLADPNLKAFGARLHQYQLGPPASRADVAQFERARGVSLPADFVAFLTHVGNGAPDAKGAAAGPFYGVYPIESGFRTLGSTASLAQHPFVRPDMTDEEWSAATGQVFDNDALSEAAYDAAYDRLYAGLLIIGHQGCDSYHALVVSGQHAGRVVNLDTEGHRPRFAFEGSFLDWYERWLDEVISGALLAPDAGWFGYERSQPATAT